MTRQLGPSNQHLECSPRQAMVYATRKELKDAMAQIRVKYPGASDFYEDIEVHLDEFHKWERSLKLESIFIRAISLPEDDDGSGIHVGRTTYHWGIVKDDGNQRKFEYVHYKPKARDKPQQRLDLKDRQFRRTLTYEHYLRLKETVENYGYEFNRNYFVPDPNPDILDGDVPHVGRQLRNMRSAAEYDADMLPDTLSDCKISISDRYNEYLQEYHESGNEYFLYRADFWRKLKPEDLTLDHQLLLAADYQNWINGYFLEKMLREEYTEAIGSL
ncbi:hypothetical protein L5515_018032 [Caenorhabditis briggsae]|uniref:Uncharacterized protein n=2 Tax=Caenorhabditis briggsae TaxID=6238 RepID=A0AAE9FIC8_CAEBR|nr:hypothetical protein L5515_018032 [Caenorhabditis briggsae]